MELPKELMNELSQISKEQVEIYGNGLAQINRNSTEDKIYVPDDLKPLQVLIIQKSVSFYKQLLSSPDSCVMCDKENCRFREREDLLDQEKKKIEFLQNSFLSELRKRLMISVETFPNILIGKNFEVLKFLDSKESELIINILIV